MLFTVFQPKGDDKAVNLKVLCARRTFIYIQSWMMNPGWLCVAETRSKIVAARFWRPPPFLRLSCLTWSMKVPPKTWYKTKKLFLGNLRDTVLLNSLNTNPHPKEEKGQLESGLMKPDATSILVCSWVRRHLSSHSAKQPTLGNDHPSMGLPKPTMLSKTKTKITSPLADWELVLNLYMNLGMEEHFKTSD